MDSFISRRHQFCLNFVSKQVARRLWWQISFTVSRDRDQRSEINNVFFWQKLLRCFIYHWVEKLYSISSEYQQFYRLPRSRCFSTCIVLDFLTLKKLEQFTSTGFQGYRLLINWFTINEWPQSRPTMVVMTSMWSDDDCGCSCRSGE